MGSIELKAHAKVNLSLDVTGKRDDGYHDVCMIMQSIELHDRVIIEKTESGIDVESSWSWVPSGNMNIAYKAAKLLFEHAGIGSGVRVYIEKRIPVAAGLAGGSSDAAAVLAGVNRLFGFNLDREILESLGKRVGADVPFCMRGGTMLAQGIGEVLTPLKPLKGVDIVLIKPRVSVSTAWVYSSLRLDSSILRPDTEKLVQYVNERRIDMLAGNMRNVLESVTAKKFSIIDFAKKRLLGLGALGSMMSGSGPTVFGIFQDTCTARRAYSELRKDKRWECILTYTVCGEN
jgi:4-diphosphocytidyl-2-C-methyl-D-erythritol kinase